MWLRSGIYVLCTSLRLPHHLSSPLKKKKNKEQAKNKICSCNGNKTRNLTLKLRPYLGRGTSEPRNNNISHVHHLNSNHVSASLTWSSYPDASNCSNQASPRIDRDRLELSFVSSHGLVSSVFDRSKFRIPIDVA